MENLYDALQGELSRCRELLEQYTSIGVIGGFGYATISSDIDMAEQAIRDNDTVEMIRAYNALLGCK